MHSVHKDHKKELEILSGPPKPNYRGIVLTMYRRELKIILIERLKSNYRRRHSTYRTYLCSDQISKDINRSERGPSTDHRKLNISPMNTYNFFMRKKSRKKEEMIIHRDLKLINKKYIRKILYKN